MDRLLYCEFVHTPYRLDYVDIPRFLFLGFLFDPVPSLRYTIYDTTRRFPLPDLRNDYISTIHDLLFSLGFALRCRLSIRM